MKSNTGARGHRGWSLIEMLVVIMLLTVFMVIASKLLVTAMVATGDADKSIAALTRNDLIITRMRRDVWDAQALAADASNTLVVSPADGPTVTWKTSGDGSSLSRSYTDGAAGRIENVYRDLGAVMSFAVDGHAVTVDIAQGPDRPTARLSLVSQVLHLRENLP